MSTTQSLALLDSIAARLHVPAAIVWASLIRQVYINAAVAIIAVLAVAGIALACRTRLWAILSAGDDFGPDTGAIAAWIVVAAAFGASIINLVVSVPAVFNPTYAALDLLHGLVK